MSALDPRTLVTSLHRRGVALELHTLDLCFLAALHVRAERSGMSSFQEDQLLDVFDQVVALTKEGRGEGGAKKRATHVVRRLRDQKLLVRVDGAGVTRAGEYALTRLATGIIGFYLEDDALTRESLDVLAGTLTACLEGVLAATRAADSEEAWRTGVIGPLRVTIFELAGGIERRQRGFDLQQEEFQREIAALLAADWFGAVERCTKLLDTTSAMLHELNDILLRHGHRFGELLQEVLERAGDAEQEEAERAARDALDQVERLAAWGAARQRAWSDYHEWVHRYLRDVVRLDPSRTLVHRLREQLAGRAGKRYALTIASAAPFTLLRSVAVEAPKPVVKSPKKEREPKLASEVPTNPDAELQASIGAALAAGATGLAEVTAQVCTPDVDIDTRFRAAGKVAQIVSDLASVEVVAERPWVAAGEGIVVEDWPITGNPVKETAS
ncbi:Chromosome partition protein MukF [Labilithrix luteola]|uniref:Chromosome partition protein MukF n=1 Tax=Labilithrix luteola TaxID=1391654 RepID=A0A0K1QDC1_9BACT|nr:Chromosome partition protein MukF [Labilithrix luteola]